MKPTMISPVPIKIPIDATAHIEAAEVSPRIVSPSRTTTPAPIKPIPLRTPCTIRLPPFSLVPISNAKLSTLREAVNKAEVKLTSANVRIPAGCPRLYLSTPTNEPAKIAAKRRRATSG